MGACAELLEGETLVTQLDGATKKKKPLLAMGTCAAVPLDKVMAVLEPGTARRDGG